MILFYHFFLPPPGPILMRFFFWSFEVKSDHIATPTDPFFSKKLNSFKHNHVYTFVLLLFAEFSGVKPPRVKLAL